LTTSRFAKSWPALRGLALAIGMLVGRGPRLRLLSPGRKVWLWFTGGPQGAVVHVTTLADSERDRCAMPSAGPTASWFSIVSGVIKATTIIVVAGDKHHLGGPERPVTASRLWQGSQLQQVAATYRALSRFRQGMTDASAVPEDRQHHRRAEHDLRSRLHTMGTLDNFASPVPAAPYPAELDRRRGRASANFGSIIDESRHTIATTYGIDNNERTPSSKRTESASKRRYNWELVAALSEATRDGLVRTNQQLSDCWPSAVAKSSRSHQYRTPTKPATWSTLTRTANSMDGGGHADFEALPTDVRDGGAQQPPVPVTVLSAEMPMRASWPRPGPVSIGTPSSCDLSANSARSEQRGPSSATKRCGGQPAVTQVMARASTPTATACRCLGKPHTAEPKQCQRRRGDSGDGYTNVENTERLADLACPGAPPRHPQLRRRNSHPVDAAVPPVDARDTPASGGATGAGGLRGPAVP